MHIVSHTVYSVEVGVSSQQPSWHEIDSTTGTKHCREGKGGNSGKEVPDEGRVTVSRVVSV